MYEGISNQKPEQEVNNGKKVKKALQEMAELTPEQRVEKGKAYVGGELRYGRLKMTQKEKEAHKQVLERRKKLGK